MKWGNVGSMMVNKWKQRTFIKSLLCAICATLINFIQFSQLSSDKDNIKCDKIEENDQEV